MGPRSRIPDLGRRLRLLLVTDPLLGAPRPLTQTVEAALKAGCPAVQLRDKTAAPRELLHQARALRTLTHRHGALLFVNDRVDVALASGADGVHLGPSDLPVDDVRRWVRDRLLVGYSTDDPAVARQAEAQGADYIGCGAVFGTRTKDVGEEAIGVAGLTRVATAVEIPTLAIGGVDTRNVARLPAAGASGAAVVSAVMAADDVALAVGQLLAPWK